MAIYLKPGENQLGTWWLPANVKKGKKSEDTTHESSSTFSALFKLCDCTALSKLCAKICSKRLQERMQPNIPLSRLNAHDDLTTVYVKEAKIGKYTMVPIRMPNRHKPEDVRCRAETSDGSLLGYVDSDSIKAMNPTCRRAILDSIQESLHHLREQRSS